MLFVEKNDSETTREHDKNGTQKIEKPQIPRKYPWKFVWQNIIIWSLMHLGAFYGIYLIFSLNTNWKTILWAYFTMVIGLQGIMSGSHRMWCHRSYKAKLPLRILLCIFQTIALQSSIYTWVQVHRAHHKYADTDGDPHNSKRGLFYSHAGWLFIEQTEEAVKSTAAVDMSDIHEDAVVMLQHKYYFTFFAPVIGFLLPACVPWYFWGEDFWTSFYVASMLRYCLVTHFTFNINSFAHKYGTRPYDKNIGATEGLTLSILSGGEGWHNYHHTFPWDYKAKEFGDYSGNWSTCLIDFMAKIGWAYDLKTVSPELIKKRTNRTGDGSRVFEEDQGVVPNEQEIDNKEEKVLWGWGDKDMTEKEREFVEIHHKGD